MPKVEIVLTVLRIYDTILYIFIFFYILLARFSGFTVDKTNAHTKLSDSQPYKFLEAEKDTGGMTSKENDPGTSSTLAKYIERFRHGSPLSRAERNDRLASTKQDFWWLNSDQSKLSGPSDTSTPNSEYKTKRCRPKDDSGALLNVRRYASFFILQLDYLHIATLT